MRYRLMATYRGVPYEAGLGPANTDVVLFAACPPPEELGFEPATGHWRKHVIRTEIDALWESRPIGSFRGEPCIVLDDLGDRLHLAYLGADHDRAASLGYWQVDRGVFELLAPRDEVTKLSEERVDKPLHWSEPPAAAAPVATYPYRMAPEPVPPVSPPSSPDLARSFPQRLPAGRYPGSAVPANGVPYPEVNAPSVRRAPQPVPAAAPGPGTDPGRPAELGGRAARRQRIPTRELFCELADLASIPRTAYSLEAETDGALCLMPTLDGYEVFIAADGSRHEVRSFSEEEAAYFYLFGVLAAEAIRNGGLAPTIAANLPDGRF